MAMMIPDTLNNSSATVSITTKKSREVPMTDIYSTIHERIVSRDHEKTKKVRTHLGHPLTSTTRKGGHVIEAYAYGPPTTVSRMSTKMRERGSFTATALRGWNAAGRTSYSAFFTAQANDHRLCRRTRSSRNSIAASRCIFSTLSGKYPSL